MAFGRELGARYPRIEWLVSVSVFPLLLGGLLWVALSMLNAGATTGEITNLALWATFMVAVLEWFFPYQSEWQRPRQDVPGDLIYMFVLPRFIGFFVTPMYLFAASSVGGWLAGEMGDVLWPRSWPLLAQLALAVICADLPKYLWHRLQHSRDLFWRFHAQHHSSQRLYWMNATRNHPLDSAFVMSISLAPLVLAGASPEAVKLYVLVSVLNAHLQHANLKLRLGPLNYLFSGPELHRWHHAPDAADAYHNFGATTILWDLIFRTYYRPRDRQPTRVGIDDLPTFPSSVWAQLLSPFRWERVKQQSRAPASPQRPEADRLRARESSWLGLRPLARDVVASLFGEPRLGALFACNQAPLFHRRWLARAVLVLVSSVGSLAAAEFALAQAGFEPFYAGLERLPRALDPSRLQAYTDCHTIEEAARRGLVRGPLGNLRPVPGLGYTYYPGERRPYPIGPDGFNEAKPLDGDYEGRTKVLVLGDSFVFGASADPGRGFVDQLKAHFAEQGVLLFNTGIGGYSQNNQLGVLETFFDTLKPDFVLLGFYTGNDFAENASPPDRTTIFAEDTTSPADAAQHFILNYETRAIGTSMSVRRRDSHEIMRLYKRTQGYDHFGFRDYAAFKPYVVEQIFFPTRLGTLTWRSLHMVSRTLAEWRQTKSWAEARIAVREEPYEVRITREYLRQIRDFLGARGVPLHVVIIPDNAESKDQLEPSANYLRAKALMQELELEHTDLFERLTLQDYVHKVEGLPHINQDAHWNNSGHRKAYEATRDALAQRLAASGTARR